MQRFAHLAALSIALGAGCGGGSGPAATPDGATVNCTLDRRVDTFAANISKTSPPGTAKITIVSSDPAPPAKGNNSWKLRVTNEAGEPISNAALTLKLFMPDHGHGTSVKPVVTPEPDGIYDVTPLDLFMAGVWRITVSTTAAAEDAVDFFFCIMG